MCYKCKNEVDKYHIEIVNTLNLNPDKLFECLSCQIAASDPSSKVIKRISALHEVRVPDESLRPLPSPNELVIEIEIDAKKLPDDVDIDLRCINPDSS